MVELTFRELFGLAIKWLAAKSDDKNNCWISESPDKLHSALMRLKQKYSAKLRPLESLHFVTEGAFPYSVEVARGLDLLQQAGMIRRENPSYTRFAPTWSDSTEVFIKNRLDEVFDKDAAARKAFEEFTEDLKELRT